MQIKRQGNVRGHLLAHDGQAAPPPMLTLGLFFIKVSFRLTSSGLWFMTSMQQVCKIQTGPQDVVLMLLKHLCHN